MNSLRTQEELLEYQVVDLSQIFSNTNNQIGDQKDAEAFFLSLMKGKITVPVELRGESQNFFLVLWLFLWLRRSAPEICYRSSPGEPGLIVYSIYSDEDRMHPHWVEGTKELNVEEVKKVDEYPEGIFIQESEVHIASLWEKVRKDFPEQSVLALVHILGKTVSDMKRVSLQGAIPILPALFVVNYLVARRKEVIWESVLLN